MDESSWVIDADGHVVEPPSMWERFLPARFLDYAPRVLQERDHFRFVCHDRMSFKIPGRAETMGTPGQTLHPDPDAAPARGADDPAARLLDMDTDHIRTAVVYPSYGLMVHSVTEPEPALALCRAINDWTAEYVAHDPSRLVGTAILPMTDAGDALGEARRCVEELGFKGVWRRPEQLEGTPLLQDASFEQLWRYLEESGTALAFHPGVNGVIPYEYLRVRYGSYYAPIHAVHFVTEQMMALTTMVAYGILERHPELRVAFLECGATWAVPYLHRLDEHLEVFGFDRARLTMKPSEYFARQCYVSVEEVEPGLADMAGRFPRSVMFASDYPHGDGTFPGSTKELLETTEIAEPVRRDLLAGNARSLYGLTPA